MEIIVIDDSPEDFEGRTEVENMISSINDSRIRYIKHPVSMGACAARNTGIKASSGLYLAFLDDDDEWLRHKLEKQMSMMAQSDIGLVYCRNIIMIDIEGVKKLYMKKFYSGWVFEKLIMENFIGSTSFPLIKKECFQECGLFNVEFQSAQDYEMWLRISIKYKVDYVDEALAIQHIHGDERITTNCEKKIQGMELINLYYGDYLKKHRLAKSIRIIKIIPYYLGLEHVEKAVTTYCQAVLSKPA